MFIQNERPVGEGKEPATKLHRKVHTMSNVPAFRTRTGQTGRDAYIFEANAIANAQRELDARMERLTTAMLIEDADLTCYSKITPTITPSKFDLRRLLPAHFSRGAHASELVRYLLSTEERPHMHSDEDLV